MSLIRRFRNLTRERELGREFDDELRFHLEARIERNIARGMTAAEAATEARRHLGSLTQTREGMRNARTTYGVDALRQDLVHGARVLRRQPALTGLVLLMLSLGIGANTAIFSLLHAAMSPPLPFREPGRVVYLVEGYQGDGSVNRPSIPALLDVRARSRTFEAVSYYSGGTFQVAGGAEPEQVSGVRVEPTLFALLGVTPAMGRVFVEADGVAGGRLDGAGAVAIVSDGFWRRSLGANPDAVGATLTIDAEPHRIVGVLAPGPSLEGLTGRVDIFLPQNPNAADVNWPGVEVANYVPRTTGIGRLAPGVSIAQASAELGSIAASIAAAHPKIFLAAGGASRGAFFMRANPLTQLAEASLLLMVVGAVGLVLLIACMNAAQFLLAQVIEREGEVALRSALGAGRARLVRQFLAEALLLSAVAGVLGILQAYVLAGALRAFLGSGPVTDQIGLNLPVLGFLAGATLITLLLSAAWPAVKFSRVNPGRSLDTRGAGRQRARGRQLFVAIEVALSLVLLVGAGLLLQSIRGLLDVDRGFSGQDVTVMRLRGIGERGDLHVRFGRMLDNIAAIPEVEVSAFSSVMPPGSPGHSARYRIVGRDTPDADLARQTAWYEVASPDFFTVLRVPLLAGRFFNDSDTASSMKVAIINREMAERFWPGESPLGRQIRAGHGDREHTMTVVGVVGNIRPSVQEGQPPQIYAPYTQQTERTITLWVRSRPGRPLPIEAVKRAVWSVEPQQAVYSIAPLAHTVWQSTETHRIVGALLGSFAVLALLMSTAGIYTLVTFLTSRRLKEIAVRRAIGATGSDIVWLVGSPTLRWTLVGIAIGIGGSVLVAQVLRSIIPGTVPLDTGMVGLIGFAYFAVVVMAMGAATIKALCVDPAIALRAE